MNLKNDHHGQVMLITNLPKKPNQDYKNLDQI